MDGVPHEFAGNGWGTTRVVRMREGKATSSLKKRVESLYKQSFTGMGGVPHEFTENGWGTTRVVRIREGRLLAPLKSL